MCGSAIRLASPRRLPSSSTASPSSAIPAATGSRRSSMRRMLAARWCADSKYQGAAKLVDALDSKPKQLGRIIDQHELAGARVGRDLGDDIGELAVVGHLARLVVRVWPVGAPDDA